MNEDKDYFETMKFAMDFAKALVNLRYAATANTSCTLQANEVKAVMQGFSLLNSQVANHLYES